MIKCYKLYFDFAYYTYNNFIYVLKTILKKNVFLNCFLCITLSLNLYDLNVLKTINFELLVLIKSIIADTSISVTKILFALAINYVW